ncbi:MAG: hypothetical protein U1E20_07895 [Methylocystis sp.]|uniref:hypothetical protein n=1 Tax=Methylocystis sp. TaxID=1911079 RepID=UPI0039495E0D
MKLTTILALGAILAAPIAIQSSAAFAAADANQPTAAETTKAPAAKHKAAKRHVKHQTKLLGKHYGRAVHHPMKHKAA